MNRPHLFLCALLFITSASAPRASALGAPVGRGDDDEESSVPVQNAPDLLGNVLQRGDTVITSTRDGFYQGSLKDKTWKKMETPQWLLPLQGTLFQQGPDSPMLVFLNRYAKPGAVPASFVTLAVSQDLGKTWEATVKGKPMSEPFFINAKGIFFTIQHGERAQHDPAWQAAHPAANPDHLLRSGDLGKTWKDITNNLPPGKEITGMFQDPDHPAQVCVSCETFSGAITESKTVMPETFIFQAADETYKWEEKNDRAHFFPPPPNAPAAPPPDATAPMHSGATGEAYGEDVQPTLTNYFALLGTTGEAYQIEVEKRAYTFRTGAPMIITARLIYLLDGKGIKTLDLPDETAFWGAIIVPMDTGKRAERPPRNVEEINSDPEDRPNAEQRKAIDGYLGDPRLIMLQIDPKHPYERKIDLAKYYDFSLPGKYHVRLLHDEMNVLRRGADLTGPLLEITITP